MKRERVSFNVSLTIIVWDKIGVGVCACTFVVGENIDWISMFEWNQSVIGRLSEKEKERA